MANYWKEPGLPHAGWTWRAMEDLEEPTEICQMCNNEGIRYVHILEHPQYRGVLRVGCQCAEKLQADYVNPKKREANLKNKASRRETFMKQNWLSRGNGNYTLRYKGYVITIVRPQVSSGNFGVALANQKSWEKGISEIRTFDEARKVAFEMFDNYYFSV